MECVSKVASAVAAHFVRHTEQAGVSLCGPVWGKTLEPLAAGRAIVHD